MRICPWPCAINLAEFEVVTVQFQGWSGKQNGELISLIDGRFDVFVTGDKNLRYQQRIETRQIAIIELPFTRLQSLEPYLDQNDDDAFELAGELIEKRERETPVSDGEIHQEDRRMLRRQIDFRNAARAVAGHLAAMPEVRQVRLFGSVALPLWKEVPRHPRLRQRNIRVFHECANIDLAVWVTSPAIAERIRKVGSQVVNDLNAQDISLPIAHHPFSIHLIDQTRGRYLGMVCHFNQCPKHKIDCLVPGCGAHRFVQILPGFQLKPRRLNEFNSQILFQRPA